MLVFGNNVELRYKNDNTFRIVVDQMRALLSAYQITPSELREASILAAVMHESECVRPLYVRFNDKDEIIAPSLAHSSYLNGPAMFGGVCVESTTSERTQSSKPNPPGNGPKDYRANHLFGKLRVDFPGNYRVCVRCGLSDVYVNSRTDAKFCKGEL